MKKNFFLANWFVLFAYNVNLPKFEQKHHDKVLGKNKPIFSHLDPSYREVKNGLMDKRFFTNILILFFIFISNSHVFILELIFPPNNEAYSK